MSGSILFVLIIMVIVSVCVQFSREARLVSSLVLLAMAAFCGFGFLACFEPGAHSIWLMIAYILGELAAVAGLFQIHFRFDRFDPHD